MPMTILDIARIEKVINYCEPPSKNIKDDIRNHMNLPLIYKNNILGFNEPKIKKNTPNAIFFEVDIE